MLLIYAEVSILPLFVLFLTAAHLERSVWPRRSGGGWGSHQHLCSSAEERACCRGTVQPEWRLWRRDRQAPPIFPYGRAAPCWSKSCPDFSEPLLIMFFQIIYHQVQADYIQTKTITQASSRYGTSVAVYYICISHKIERRKGHSFACC